MSIIKRIMKISYGLLETIFWYISINITWSLLMNPNTGNSVINIIFTIFLLVLMVVCLIGIVHGIAVFIQGIIGGGK